MGYLRNNYYFNHSEFALYFARKALNLGLNDEIEDEDKKDVEIFALAYSQKYWEFTAKRLAQSIIDLAEGGEISYQTAEEIIEKAQEGAARDRMRKEKTWLSYGEGYPYGTAYIMAYDNEPEEYTLPNGII